jgi:hypothetical protein
MSRLPQTEWNAKFRQIVSDLAASTRMDNEQVDMTAKRLTISLFGKPLPPKPMPNRSSRIRTLLTESEERILVRVAVMGNVFDTMLEASEAENVVKDLQEHIEYVKAVNS